MSRFDANSQQVHELRAGASPTRGDRPAHGSKNPIGGTIRPLTAVLAADGPIGRAVVEALIEARRPVVAVAADSRPLADLVAVNPRSDLQVLTGSVAHDADARRLATELRGLGRAIDAAVIAPSGECGRGRLLDHATDRLQQALEHELLPQLAIARELLPLLAEGGRCGRYVLVTGPGSERPWAGYGYRSVTAAALRMLAQVLHDEARSLAVRVQLLAVDSPVGSEPRRPHECGEWPSAAAVGRYVVELIEREPAASAGAVVHFEERVDSTTPRATTSGGALEDVRALPETVTAQTRVEPRTSI